MKKEITLFYGKTYKKEKLKKYGKLKKIENNIYYFYLYGIDYNHLKSPIPIKLKFTGKGFKLDDGK